MRNASAENELNQVCMYDEEARERVEENDKTNKKQKTGKEV